MYYNTNEIYKVIFKLLCLGKINIEDIECLLQLKVFTKKEEKYILDCLETIRTLGSISYDHFIENNRCYSIKTNTDLSDFLNKPYLIYQIIQAFIEQRTKDMIVNNYVNACEREKEGYINQTDNLLYRLKNIFINTDNKTEMHYLGAEYCREKVDKVYYNMANFYNKSEKGITFGNKIDKYFTGILPYKTLCLIGNNVDINRFFSTNLIYKALQKNKNVCYLSLNSSKELQLLDFIAKYTLENNKLLNYEKIINRKLKLEEFEKNVEDFRIKYGSNFKIIDETDLIEFNEVYIRRALGEVNSVFLKTKGKGVEILVIDSIERLKLNTVKGNIHNETAIITHYLDLFRGLQKSVEFNNLSVVMLSEYTNSGKYTAINNDGNIQLSDIKVGISNYADIIISIYNNTNLLAELQDECKVKVLKDNNMPIMTEPINIKINREQFCFKKKEISLIKSRYNKLFYTKQARAILNNYRKQKETKLN